MFSWASDLLIDQQACGHQHSPLVQFLLRLQSCSSEFKPADVSILCLSYFNLGLQTCSSGFKPVEVSTPVLVHFNLGLQTCSSGFKPITVRILRMTIFRLGFRPAHQASSLLTSVFRACPFPPRASDLLIWLQAYYCQNSTHDNF